MIPSLFILALGLVWFGASFGFIVLEPLTYWQVGLVHLIVAGLFLGVRRP